MINPAPISPQTDTGPSTNHRANTPSNISPPTQILVSPTSSRTYSYDVSTLPLPVTFFENISAPSNATRRSNILDPCHTRLVLQRKYRSAAKLFFASFATFCSISPSLNLERNHST